MITEIPITTEIKCPYGALRFRQDKSFRDHRGPVPVPVPVKVPGLP
jgi:hypothetical protein